MTAALFDSLPAMRPAKPPTWPGCSFFAPGIPKAQPRPRAFAKKFGNGQVAARMYDSGTAEEWKSQICRAIERCLPPVPAEGPICVSADFIFPRPSCLERKRDPTGRIPHTRRPDRDNLDKALLDCLKTIGVFKDDWQVCGGEVRKWFAARGERPGVHVRIATGGPTP